MSLINERMVFRMENLKIIILLLVGIIIVLLALGHNTMLQKQFAKQSIISLGKAMQELEIEKMKHQFVINAEFVYEEEYISYIVAISNLKNRISKQDIKGDIYVDSIDRLYRNSGMISFVCWLSLNGKSHEVSGSAIVKRVGLFTWKIQELSSQSQIFREVFFERL